MSLSQPLPERLRPSELALFVGQSHLAERLTTLLEGPRLPSLLLFGPPGCGKSTLALLLARARGGNVLRLSAPEAGLQQLRRQLTGVDILVLDELHRFSKAQQDFFLPLLESGDLTMIATTTTNTVMPYTVVRHVRLLPRNACRPVTSSHASTPPTLPAFSLRVAQAY